MEKEFPADSITETLESINEKIRHIQQECETWDTDFLKYKKESDEELKKMFDFMENMNAELLDKNKQYEIKEKATQAKLEEYDKRLETIQAEIKLFKADRKLLE